MTTITPGQQCTKNGITASMLLSYVSSDVAANLPEVEIITNGLLLELVRFKDQHSQCTLKTLYGWIKDLYGDKWPQEQAPTSFAINKSIERLNARLTKLKKNHTGPEKDDLISEFLLQEYILPKLGFYRGRVLHFSPAKKRGDTATACKDHTSEQLCREVKKKMYALTRNANKRLKRREAVIQKQKIQIHSQLQTITTYERKLEGAESKLSKLKAKINRVNHRAEYWRTKVENIHHHSSEVRTKLRHEIESLREEISCLDTDNAEMRDVLESLISSEEIATFESGKYTDDVRACIYELLSLNVGVRNIAPVIRCVLKNIAHKSVSRLPSHGLTCQMILESLTVVQAQLGQKLSETAASTLQTDGTTKFGEHYATYDIRVPEATYTLGLRHVFSGSAQNTLETLKEILDDIDSVHLALGKQAASSKIVAKLKNTMSDRHTAEKLFNEVLEDFRAEILPTVAANWEEMTEIEREQLTRMNNFFCGLHFLVGLADTAEEALKQWEAHSFCGEVPAASSGTQRLIRTACKAFHHRGSQQCGSSTLFRAYLKKQGLHKIPLAHFVGNRFNILFFDAAGVYYLRHHMVHFIESVHGRQANRLLQAVLADLREPMYTAGCRALGLIDKVITGPLWRKMKESSLSILEMGAVYCEMKTKFDTWSNDPHTLIEGSACLEQANAVHNDDVWTALVESNTSDTMTIEVLQLLMSAFSLTSQRLLVDHLPGGKYHQSVVDSELLQETATVPTTNVAPERDFAILDRLIREKPNASLVALESMILFSQNRSSLWLNQQTNEEQEKLFKAARTLAPSIREKFKARRKEIEAKHEEALVKKQQCILQKQIQTVQEKEVLTKEVEKIGLWMSLEDIERGLERFSRKTDRVKALKLQIKFRHKVLGQSHCDKSVFQFSKNRKQHSVDHLKSNLCQLLTGDRENASTQLDQNDQVPSLEDVLHQPDLLVGKRIKHRFQVDGKLVWYEGTVLQLDFKTNEFQIIYDGEDDICVFSLLDDILSGDLIILS